MPDSKPVTVALVLTTPAGTALRRNTFNRQVWAPALRMTGVEQTRDNGMQACRHTYAKVLLDAGESIKAVSEYLGHADPGFALWTYTHLMPESTEWATGAVGNAFGR